MARGVADRHQADLFRAYDDSGEMLMHLQAAEAHDVFARALSIGPETMVMHFLPDQPMHARYAVDHGFLSPQAGRRVRHDQPRPSTPSSSGSSTPARCWSSAGRTERPTRSIPIDYANACPDVAITSLHYYFPWAMKALVKWSAYCLVTERDVGLDMQTRRYYAIAKRTDLSYDGEAGGYRKLADEYFDTERYYDWCDSRLRPFDEIALEWFSGPGMDSVIVDTVRCDVPPARARPLHRALPRARGAVVPGGGAAAGPGHQRARLTGIRRCPAAAQRRTTSATAQYCTR